MGVEYKGGGPVLMIDGEFTPEGRKWQTAIETKGASVEYKVVFPPDPAKKQPVSLTPAERARIAALLREVRETLGESTPSDHPVVRRGLRLLAHRYARVR